VSWGSPPNRAVRGAFRQMNGSAMPEVSGYVLDVFGHAHPREHAFFVSGATRVAGLCPLDRDVRRQ